MSERTIGTYCFDRYVNGKLMAEDAETIAASEANALERVRRRYGNRSDTAFVLTRFEPTLAEGTKTMSEELDAAVGCYDCGEPYASPRFHDLVLPNDVWKVIAPNDGNGLLCPNCICARLEKAGLSGVSSKFTSGPLALSTRSTAIRERDEALAEAERLRKEVEFVAGLQNPERMSGRHLTDEGRAQLAFCMIDNAVRRAKDAITEDRCLACNRPLREGEEVYNDVSGGIIHAACCGPERESYVGADGQPLKDGEPIPKPWKWTDHPKPARATLTEGKQP